MTLKTRDGIEFDTYETGPADACAGVLIIHDWWGMLKYNREWADRLAELGYRVLVADLYDGVRAHNAQEAGELMRSIDQDEADSKLLAAIDRLKKGGCQQIAALGWSFGGRQAMQAALLDPESVVSAVLFYCRMLTDPEALADLGGPVLAIYSTTETTWPEKMERFDRAMAEAGRMVESRAFEAGHGFVNPESERYDATAAEEAWAATTEFLLRTVPVT